MITLYVISHTEASHHLDNLVGGWFDSELTEKGLADAETMAQRLSSEASVDCIYSSDLARAHSTAQTIAKVCHAPIELTHALREMSFGEAEGKPQSWLDERIQPEDGENRMDHRIVSNAETKREFAGRIYNYLESLSLPETAVISTHAFAATFVIAWWIRMPLESLGYVNFGIKPGKITKLVEDDFFKNRAVSYLNQ
jgi:probable phosphoglycerate mutase